LNASMNATPNIPFHKKTFMEDNLQNTFDASILRFEVRIPFKINSIPHRFSHQGCSGFNPF